MNPLAEKREDVTTDRTKWLMSLLVAVAVGALAMWLWGLRGAPSTPPQVPLLSLEKMGHLVSVKVNYADVIEFTEKRTLDIPWTNWELPLGGTRVLLVARGDCTVGTNLGEARYEEVNAERRTVNVVLSAPRTIQARVNHDPREQGGSYFYAISSEGLEPIIPDTSNRTQAINNALALAQKEVERTCRQTQVLTTATKNAEEVLGSAFQAIGWTPTFVWK